MSKLRLSTAATIAILLGATAAQSQDVTKHKPLVKAPKPAVQDTTAVPPDPAVMQKWFSGAVENILTNTDRTLNTIQGPAR